MFVYKKKESWKKCYLRNNGNSISIKEWYLVVFDFATFENGDYIDNGILKACIRKVTLRQLGQFMMGETKINDVKISLSGSLGADGLPCSFWSCFEGCKWKNPLVQVPKEITSFYWGDTGHNDVCETRPLFLEWAQENWDALRKAGQPSDRLTE